jgi:hypothetical protein
LTAGRLSAGQGWALSEMLIKIFTHQSPEKMTKAMKSRILKSVLLFSTLLPTIQFAAEPSSEGVNPYKQRPHVIGVQASSVAGLGLDYKYAFGDLLHWRVTGMIFPSKTSYSNNIFYNIGTDIQFNIFQVVTGPNTFVRGYVAPAISLWVNDYSSGYNTKNINAGVTLGFELVIASRFNIHGDLGLGYYQYGSGSSYYTAAAGGLGIGILF